MLSVLARLDIRTTCTAEESSTAGSGPVHAEASSPQLSVRPRRQTKERAMEALRDSEVNIEQVRVNRVGCLLANLARRVRSLGQLGRASIT